MLYDRTLGINPTKDSYTYKKEIYCGSMIQKCGLTKKKKKNPKMWV